MEPSSSKDPWSYLTLSFGRTHTIGTGGMPIIATPFINLKIKSTDYRYSTRTLFKPLVMNVVNVSDGIFENRDWISCIISSFVTTFQNLKGLIMALRTGTLGVAKWDSSRINWEKTAGHSSGYGSPDLMMKILSFFNFSPWFNHFAVSLGFPTEKTNKVRTGE